MKIIKTANSPALREIVQLQFVGDAKPKQITFMIFFSLFFSLF